MRIKKKTAALLFVLFLVVSFAIPATLAEEKASLKTEGGGKIASAVPGTISTFGFIAENNSGIAKGHIQYYDHGAKIKLHGNVTTLTVLGTTAEFSGTAIVTNSTGAKRELSYTVEVSAGKKDVGTFTISILPALDFLPSGYIDGGALRGGDIKVCQDE